MTPTAIINFLNCLLSHFVPRFRLFLGVLARNISVLLFRCIQFAPLHRVQQSCSRKLFVLGTWTFILSIIIGVIKWKKIQLAIELSRIFDRHLSSLCVTFIFAYISYDLNHSFKKRTLIGQRIKHLNKFYSFLNFLNFKFNLLRNIL